MEDLYGNVFCNLFYSISNIKSKSKYYIPLSFFNLILNLILNLMNMLVLKFIFDNFNNNINKIFIGLAIYFLFNLLIGIFESWYQNYFLSKENLRVKKKIDNTFYENIIECKFSILMSSDIYSDYILAINNSTDRILSIYNDFVTIIFNIFNIILVSFIMVSIDIRLLLLCIAFPIINFMLNLKLAKNDYQKETQLVEPKKILKYIDRIFYLKDYVKNLRLYKTKNAVFDLFTIGYNSFEKFNNKYNKNATLIYIIKNLLNVLFSIVVICTLTAWLYLHKITIGNFTLIYNTTTNLTSSLSSTLDIIPNIYKNSLLLDKYIKFINITNSSINNNTEPLKFHNGKFEVQNVSYKFENSDEYILKDISFNIDIGEKIAILGKNGSGKTTLFKLLLNLYEPYSGKLLFNNIDYKNYTNNFFLENCGVVFQNPKVFSFSIHENIKMNSCLEKDPDKSTLEKSTKIVNLNNKINTFSNKENTYVTKEIDPNGAELSGGELKKIAIARIFQYNFNIVFIDELSTALDNESHKKIMNHLLSSDKTIISITHDIKDVKLFDKIILLDGRQLIELGSFDELIRSKGYFYELYKRS